MKQSLVRLAADAFYEQDYQKAQLLYQKASATIGKSLFDANIALCKNRFEAEMDRKYKTESNKASHNSKGVKYADSFKVALIADEFTSNSFSNEFEAIPIEPSNWKSLFEKDRPDVFFCESAWSGADSIRRPWKGQVYASKNFQKENRTALLAILDHCRKNGIPSVFWNKEDPTHHTDRVHDFVKTAKEFDFVFTTASECVESYKKNYGVQRAYALPFATNPRLFNPIEIGSRSSRVVFAGSWYANHIQRSIDMENILDRITQDGFELEIYDRYHGDNDPLHKWPDRYQSFLNPSRPHDQMPEVYKASRFGLNFNTVTDSPTMFARRVFELMSCNTLVISNYARGTQEIFGDLIVYPDRDPGRLRELSDGDIEQIRARSLKKVLSEHTYKHRWSTILGYLGLPFATRDVSITVVKRVHKRADAVMAVAWFTQYGRKLPEGALLLVADISMPSTEVASIYQEFNRFGVTVTSHGHAQNYAILGAYQPVQTTHFIALSEKQPPDTERISDALLHLQYMREYPIVMTEIAEKRFHIDTMPESCHVIDAKHRFASWLTGKNSSQNAYFV